MGIFDRFPYSSTHEMNLDFMLGKAQEINQQLQTVQTGMQEVQTGLSQISEQTTRATTAAAAAEAARDESQQNERDAFAWTEQAEQHADRAEAALSQMTDDADRAETAAQNASNSATAASSSADIASQNSARAAQQAANAQLAAHSAQDALNQATVAANNAQTSATSAADAAALASGYNSQAATSATNAATSATNAAASATSVLGTEQHVQNLVESIPEDYTTLSNDVDGLKSAFDNLDTDLNEFYGEVFQDRKIKNNFVRGKRFLNNGWSTAQDYAVSELYPAGDYKVSTPIQPGFVVVGYVSDTEGQAIIGTWTVNPVEFTANIPFYITFNAVLSDTILDNINNNFSLYRIYNNDNTIDSRVKTLEDAVEPVSNAFEYVYSKNRYDGEYTDEGGYIVPTTGAVGINSAYSPSGWIDISNHGNSSIVYSQRTDFKSSGVRYALYDENKVYITGALLSTDGVILDADLGRYYCVITAPENAKYMRFSVTANAFRIPNPNMQIEYTSPTAYEAYSGESYTIKNSAIEKNSIIKELIDDGSPSIDNDIVKSMTYGVTPLQKTKESFVAGDTLIAETNSIKKNFAICFFAKITSVGTILLGHGRESYGYYVKIDGTNLTYASNGVDGTAIPHGLTLEDYLGVIIEVDKVLNAKITIITKGGVFSRTQGGWTGSRGSIFCENVNASLTDAVLTWNCDDYKQAMWAFGDSYFATNTNIRWPYWVVTAWNFDNVLLNGFPGEASASAYDDLLATLNHGTPKYLLWCLGMNDPDTSTGVNSAWLEKVEAIKTLCTQRGITLIMATIPNVTNTSYNNTFKNQYVVTSGYRYVDFAGAVSDVSGWLSDDGVHPNEIGARLLAVKAITDCPELIQKS